MRDRRLGIYFESLWQFFLSQDEEVELVACNLPVHDGSRTLGEFDVLYFCRRRNCHVHLELAVKFYLGWTRGDAPRDYSATRDWLGPDPGDRLDMKVDHLLAHQIQLGGTDAARPLLERLRIDRLAREIEMKGYLFGPLSAAIPPPKAFDRRQSIHRWRRLGQPLDTSPDTCAESYLILPRMQWMSPAQATPADRLFTLDELFATLQEKMARLPHPRLVAALDKAGCEAQRFFVTGPEWPALPDRPRSAG
jgi:hypothetical protein